MTTNEGNDNKLSNLIGENEIKVCILIYQT